MQDPFKENFSLKLLSFFMAITIWLFVISKGLSDITMEVPVKFNNLPTNLSLLRGENKITINVEGPERLVKNLHKENITVRIDLSEAKLGNQVFNVTKANIKMPGIFRVKSISPEFLKLTFDRKIFKRIAVSPVLMGKPVKGLLVKKVETIPDKVKVEGPLHVLNYINLLNTLPVDIEGISEDHEYKVALHIKDKNLKTNIKNVLVSVYLGRLTE